MWQPFFPSASIKIRLVELLTGNESTKMRYLKAHKSTVRVKKDRQIDKQTDRQTAHTWRILLFFSLL